MSDSGSTQSTQPSQQSSAAVEAAGDTAGVAAEQGRNVASTATEQAKAVAGAATSQVRSVTDEARQQAGRVVDDASTELQKQLEQRLGQLVKSARGGSDQLRALHEGRTDEAGRSGDLARQASDRLGQLADRADELGLKGVMDEAARFARQRPLAFLAGAAVAGVVVGRMVRSARDVGEGSGSGGTPGDPSALPARAGRDGWDDGAPNPSSAEVGTLGGPTGAVVDDETGLGLSGVTVPASSSGSDSPGGLR